MKIQNAKVLLGAAALAVAFLGGIAFAPTVVAPAAAQLLGSGSASTTGNGGPRGADLFTVAARYIGITADQLRTEMGTTKSMADVAVAHGKTRDGLIQALKTAEEQNIDQRISDLVDHKGFSQKPPFGPGAARLFFGANPLQTASTYLGISDSDLKTKLQSGQSLGQIANATAGKSRDGLIQAIVQADTTKIDQGVTDGKITSAQATTIKSSLTQRVTHLVDHAGPGPWGGPGSRMHVGPGDGFGPGGFGWDFGPKPAAPTSSPASQ